MPKGGGQDFEDRSQDIYQGKIIGDMTEALDVSRLRMLGGTSNHWGGYCRPMDAIDFEERANVPFSGWPISKDDLAPYRTETSEILEVQTDFKDQTRGDLIFADYGFSPPVLFGEKYHDLIDASDRMTVILNANFNRVTLEEGRITQAEVRGYQGGSWQIEAREYVLCLGGIENARMLMWANIQADHQLVQSEDQIGRYWMDHPDIFVGQALLTDPSPELFRLGPSFHTTAQAFVSLSPKLQEAHGIGNFMFNIRLRDEDTKRMLESLLCFAPRLGMSLVETAGRTLICGAYVHAQLEQWPDPNNRVLLDQEQDAFGVPKTALLWHYTPETNAEFLRSFQAFGEAMATEDLGRVRMLDWADEGRMPPPASIGSHKHHMGGTRMSVTARDRCRRC